MEIGKSGLMTGVSVKKLKDSRKSQTFKSKFYCFSGSSTGFILQIIF